MDNVGARARNRVGVYYNFDTGIWNFLGQPMTIHGIPGNTSLGVDVFELP